MADLEDFRRATRDWLEDNCPAGARGDGYVPIGSTRIALEPDTARWLQRMVDRGWTVPTWPKCYGGAELSRDEYRVLIQELQRIGARPPLTGRGVNYIGPTILEYGTDEQKAKWLPRCARGEGAWAMGYSEPGAGSDLASLGTRAVRQGDHYRINGSKIWTSNALDCDYIFILARTSPDKPKHQGISLILVDLAQPGVTVKPIELISGGSDFCQVFFDDAMAPVDDLIGGEDNGWTVGKRLLQFERSTHAGINTSGAQGGLQTENRVREMVVQRIGLAADAKLADTALRDRLLRFEMNTHAQRITQQRAIEESKAHAPGFTSSAVKLTNALNIQEGDDLLVAALGTSILQWDSDDPEQRGALRRWLYDRSLTIAGGTKEIQLNIIAKRVLGLPD